MGAMKQFYTASLEYDRETGANLCAWPEWRQHDMRATDGVSSGARDQMTGARDLLRQGRKGTASRLGDGKYWFIVDSTRRFRTGRGNRYIGWIETHNGRVVDGECDCPDEDAYLRGFMVCKHQLWAALKVQARDFVDRVPVRLTLAWSEELGSCVLLHLREGVDPVRAPTPGETLVAMRERLKREGRHREVKILRRDYTIDEVYA